MDEEIIFNNMYVHFEQEFNFDYTGMSDKQIYLYKKKDEIISPTVLELPNL